MRKLFFGLLATGMALHLNAQSVKIGWLGPETGESALWGQAEKNTVLMLAEQQNAKGGVEIGGKRYRIEIIPYDDKGDSAEAVKAIKQLIHQDKVIAIVGAQGSGEAIPAAPLLNDAKIPLVSSAATHPKVTVNEAGVVHPFVFRACFTDPYQGKAAAYYAYQKLEKRKAALLKTLDDPYSTGLAELFRQNFEKAGGKIVSDVGYKSGEKDFRGPLTKIKDSAPDMVFIPAYYSDVALIAKQARELGVNQFLMGGDGWPSDTLIPSAGTALEGCMFINHLDMYGPEAKPLWDAYKAKFNKNPELNSYLVHDALLMVIDAMQRAKSTDPVAIQSALSTCDVKGLTGQIKIGPQHDPENKAAWVIKIVGKEMKLHGKFVGAE